MSKSCMPFTQWYIYIIAILYKAGRSYIINLRDHIKTSTKKFKVQPKNTKPQPNTVIISLPLPLLLNIMVEMKNVFFPLESA